MIVIPVHESHDGNQALLQQCKRCGGMFVLLLSYLHVRSDGYSILFAHIAMILYIIIYFNNQTIAMAIEKG